MRVSAAFLSVALVAAGLFAPAVVVAEEAGGPPKVSSRAARPKATVPLLSYFSHDRQDHLYLTSFSVLGEGKAGYAYQGVEGYAWPKGFGSSVGVDASGKIVGDDVAGGKGPGDGGAVRHEPLVPLYRYFDKARGDHFYSADAAPTSGERVAEGVECLVLKNSAAVRGTVPLHSYYNKVMGDHFLTTDLSKLGPEGRAGWKYIGAVGRVFPTPDQLQQENPGDGSTVAVRRFFNHVTGDHLLTDLQFEQDNAWYGWAYEGISFYCYRDAQPGTVPLRLFYSTASSDHLVSASPALAAGSPVWALQSELCNVALKPKAGLVPLYRYFNADMQDHYYTTDGSKLGRDPKAPKLGFVYQGIECYVLPHALEGAPALPDTATRPRLPVFAWWNSRYRTHAFVVSKETERKLEVEWSKSRHGWTRAAGKGEGRKPVASASDKAPSFSLFAAARGDETDEVFSFFDHETQDYFYTTRYTEDSDPAASQWRTALGPIGHVDVRQTAGTVPLYRYYNETLGDAFLSTAVIPPKSTPYVVDGILGFVPSQRTDNLQGGSIQGNLPADLHLVPLRQIADASGAHRYSASRDLDADSAAMNRDKGDDRAGPIQRADVGAAAGSLFLQGTAAYCHRVQITGTIPLYEFASASGAGRAYSTAKDEFASGSWSQPAVACYVTDHRVAGSVPLRRYISRTTGDHIYATHEDSVDLDEYKYQGIQAYVFPSAVPTLSPHDTSFPIKSTTFQ